MSKSIIGLVLSIAVLAILLTGCSDEPDPIPPNETDSSITVSSDPGVNPEPTHAPTSAVTNIAASEVATPTPAALPTATATPTATANAAAPKTRSAGEFASVSTGASYTCGVRTDGGVECWGLNAEGQATPPSGEFASVSAGWGHTCGVRTDGAVECWGSNEDSDDNVVGQATPPSGEFASVSAGGGHTCGVRTDGPVVCWGDDDNGQATPPSGGFASVSAGSNHTCGMRRDGSVACWGYDSRGQATPPSGELALVSAGGGHTCGVRTDGSVECWGRNDDGQATPPSGEFASVSAGNSHVCGVRTDGSVECWGSDSRGQATPPSGEFASVRAGGGHTCGVRTDGAVECWGFNKDENGNVVGQATPPSGEFASVSAGGDHACGVRPDGSVECWGYDGSGEATPPSGEFTSVSAANIHTCGVRPDGSVECWGANDDGEGNVVGQATPPGGSFTSAIAGGLHTCGVRTDGAVECWGFNKDENGNVVGQATPPSGEFASVSAGGLHTSGVRTDGSVDCWGYNKDGQASPPSSLGGESTDASGKDTGDEPTTRDASGLVWQGPFYDLMKLIPLTEDSRSIVSFNGYRLAREANGIQAPAEDASDQDLEGYLRELGSTGLAAGPWISGFTRESMAQLEQKYLGFGVVDVERSILAGEPPYTLEAVSGRFDPETTDASLAACAECDKPEIQEHLGVKFYSWGEDYKPDLKKRLQPPAYDVLGRGGRIAVLDSVVFRTLGTAGMRSLIRTYGGNGDSLADDPDLALAAGALQNLGVYSALLAGDVERFTGPLDSLLSPEERDQLQMEAGTTSEKYSVLGAGVAKDSDGFVTILVLVYEDEGAASRNVQDFEERLANGRSMLTGQPWTEYFPEGEVWNDGRALIARLRTEHPRIWEQMVLSVDSLLWQE